MHILGVKVHTLAKKQALEQVKVFLAGNGQHTIFTPNPEMLVEASKDSYFKEILNHGSLNLCDGRGIELASKQKIDRIPGVDFMVDLCALAEQEGKSVYLLGSYNKNVVEKTVQKLKQKFPLLRVVGFHLGPEVQVSRDMYHVSYLTYNEEENASIVEDIIRSAPDILFVAFGHNKQERWIYEFLPQLPSVKIAMGVGGAFDYLSGSVKRSPVWMRKFGLEWLYRVIMQPHRLKRIWNATVVFGWYVLFKNSS